MERAVRTVFLDVYEKNRAVSVWIKQYDGGGRALRAVLSAGGKPYRVGAACTVLLTVTRPDGQTETFSSCTVLSDGSVLAVIPLWAAQADGVGFLSLTVFGDDEERLTTPDMALNVEPGTEDDDPTEDEDYSVLTGLITQCNSLKASFQNSLAGGYAVLPESAWEENQATLAVSGLTVNSLVILVPDEEITRYFVQSAGVYIPADIGTIVNVNEGTGTVVLKRRTGEGAPTSLFFRVFRIETTGNTSVTHGAGVVIAGGASAAGIESFTASGHNTLTGTVGVTGLLTNAILSALTAVLGHVMWDASTDYATYGAPLLAAVQAALGQTANIPVSVSGNVTVTGGEQEPRAEYEMDTENNALVITGLPAGSYSVGGGAMTINL